MASKDNDNSLGMAVAFVFAGLMAIGIFIFAVLAFLAFVLTCRWALNTQQMWASKIP